MVFTLNQCQQKQAGNTLNVYLLLGKCDVYPSIELRHSEKFKQQQKKTIAVSRVTKQKKKKKK